MSIRNKLRIIKDRLKNKKKTIALAAGIVFGSCFGMVKEGRSMGIPQRPSIHRIAEQDSYTYGYIPRYIPIVPSRVEKIRFIATHEMVPLIYIDGYHGYINEQLLKKLRAGSLSGNLILLAIGGIVYILAQSVGVDAFGILDPIARWNAPSLAPGANPTYGSIPSHSRRGSTVEIHRPTSMPHQEFVDLTKEERRALPHSNDMRINHEGHPKLEVGFWQSIFKVGDHGAVHDLPYTVKKNGGTKTPKTEDNALTMMKSIVEMPNRENVLWFEEGSYQGGTDREFEAVHIYDPDKRVIAVFKKSTGKFVTTCQLTEAEDAELKATGNFGGGKGWFSGQVKNLPPQQTEQTAVNTFESDVMGITPVSPMDENSSPDAGFTPLSSFENDVMGISPIDKSQLDNP